MGGGSSKQASLPPPPVPTPKYDAATSAAENALATQAKQSFGSSVESDDDKRKASSLGAVAPSPAGQPRRRREMAPATMMNAGGLNASAVLTG